jgi:serine O-acetyltransferase
MLRALQLLREDLRHRARVCPDAGGASAVVLYRLAQGAREARLLPLEVAFGAVNALVNRCVIGRGADLGPGLVLEGGRGVVIEGAVRGGARLHLGHEVSLGDRGGGLCPVLGDDVRVAAGAKILGPVAVGDGARVGLNAVVVKDVPPGATVEGVPARVVG